MKTGVVWLMVCWAFSVCAAVSGPIVFSGLSDASAAVALDAQRFVVADDEHNTLGVYRIDSPSASVGQIDLTAFLSIDDKHSEADIEGAARVGDRIYWIASHGRNKDGKERPNRYAFFATDIVYSGSGEDRTATLKPVGQPYRRLAYDLMGNPALQSLKLSETIVPDRLLSKKELKSLAPKESGLNIEGLAAGPEGSVLIGLRNPVYRDPASQKDMAVVLVLKNPEAIVTAGQAAQFGSPILLDVEGLGIRSIEYITPASGAAFYVIAAGPADGENKFAFYTWPGGDSPAKKLFVRLPEEFAPEAIFQIPGTDRLWVLSDDGTLEKPVANAQECLSGELLKNGKCPNRFMADPNHRTFRAIPLHWDAPAP